MTTPATLVRLALALTAVLAAALPAQEVVRTFAVRIDGRTVGSVVETESDATEDGRAVRKFTSRTVAKVELLGAAFDQRIEQTWVLDPATRAVLRFESTLRAGTQKVDLSGRLVDGRLQLDGGREPVDPARVVVAPDLRWLLARGPQQPGARVELDCLLPELGGVQRVVVALDQEPDRQLDVLGKRTPVRVYRLGIVALGLETTAFVTRDAGELVRYEVPAQKTVLERVAPADVARLDRVDVTERILVRTNVDLGDATRLEFVRLRAAIDTGGDVTVAALNGPGQRFEGTVENGRVRGVFELRARRPDGAGGPPFPPPAETFAAASLRPWLAPEPGVVESDDPAIAAQARQLAEGARSCFQVVERLARWVHDEIPYAIPGGGSAKGTFELRQGECAGHSRLLAAMLRALGIPARTPMGGMYTPLHGGSFAQHMWNEVWLGEAIGWLAVDCTAGQFTFVDATHIRLADGITMFRPLTIEVLDHAPKAAVAATPAVARRAGAFPFAAAEPLVFTWSQQGRQLGDERVVYSTTPEGQHVFEGSLRLADGAFEEVSRTVVGADGRLLSFHADRTEGPQQSTIDVRCADGRAAWRLATAGEERSDSAAVDPAVFPLHNNCTSHFLLALSRYGPLPDGAEVEVRLFHTELRSVLPMTLRGAGAETIRLGDAEVRARRVMAELAGLAITLHVDDEGRLLRYHQKQGGVTIERRRP
ncbi:MAG: transglutaminase domain-containing protein [Planctomycetes bacterium]|nr:transglutaminase domain-containing protein [Planctomycetota bacterium]